MTAAATNGASAEANSCSASQAATSRPTIRAIRCVRVAGTSGGDGRDAGTSAGTGGGSAGVGTRSSTGGDPDIGCPRGERRRRDSPDERRDGTWDRQAEAFLKQGCGDQHDLQHRVDLGYIQRLDGDGIAQYRKGNDAADNNDVAEHH